MTLPVESRTSRATAQPALEALPKWWASSMTVWGAVITGVATVLPTVAPLAGVDIGRDLAQQLGDDAIRIVQGVSGVAGLLLTIYGRVRAARPLERPVVSLKL